MAGQSYADAIDQFRNARDPKTRLFRFKAGCLVNFAMDLNEVYMTTRLNGQATFFLPFNMGRGKGVDAGKGNPLYEDKYSVSYLWEDILTKDTQTELIFKFIFIDRKEERDELTGKRKVKENVIFPRYHQLDVVRRLLADVRANGSSRTISFSTARVRARPTPSHGWRTGLLPCMMRRIRRSSITSSSSPTALSSIVSCRRRSSAWNTRRGLSA